MISLNAYRILLRLEDETGPSLEAKGPIGQGIPSVAAPA